ncbi:hypothetical protein [Promicromonospora sp. NPDC090134]|uniref:hypothetical protein n=1 Tax=Promicromonospora sp. NPDC090134 TaxID=3364408 RepID=UPI0038230270
MTMYDTHPTQDAALAAGIHTAGSMIETPGDLDPALLVATAVRNVRRRRVARTAGACLAALVLAGAGLGVLGAAGAHRGDLLPGSDRAAADATPSTGPSTGPSDGAPAGPDPSGRPVGGIEYPLLEPLDHVVPAGWKQVELNGLSFAVPESWTSEATEGQFTPGVEWTGQTVTHVNGGVDPEELEDLYAQLPGAPDLTAEELEAATKEHPEYERVYVQGGKPGGNWWTQTDPAPWSQMITVPGADYAEVQPSVLTLDGEPERYDAQIYLHQSDRGENLFLVVEFDGTEQGWKDLHAFLGTLDFRR